MCLHYKSLKKIVGEGEIARNEQFLLFPQCFLQVLKTFCHFHQISKLSSANSFSLEESKNLLLWKGLKEETPKWYVSSTFAFCFVPFPGGSEVSVSDS